MGLDINAARFLLGEQKRGVRFGRTVSLGHQGIYMDDEVYGSFLQQLNVGKTGDFADDFFLGVGASSIEAMDASPYEGATIIHDINEPIPSHLRESVDTLIDGGTLEHVFNFPNSIRNCMEMVKTGGQLILMTPWHNFSGHGFYQFSPELFYSTLSIPNGFKIERMLISVEGNWYSVKDPRAIRSRVEISTKDQVLLYITARKVSQEPPFLKWPQQSDYSVAWQSGPATRKNVRSIKSRLVEAVPLLRALQNRWRHRKREKSLSPDHNHGLTRICPSGEIPS